MNSSDLERRFLSYVKINTQSDPNSTDYPSSRNQRVLAEMLVNELQSWNIDVSIDEFSYIIATIPSNLNEDVPALFFCSHFDTSPDCTAEDVNPIVHRNYDGKDIILPSDPKQVIRTSDFPELAEKKGKDIITADGRTLLGADNKAGLAELMEVAYTLSVKKEIKHGKIIFLFTPDEEIGKDTIHLDVKKIHAKFGYSVDGHALASVNNQTFYVGNAAVEIFGSTIHTGKGQGIMESAIKIAMKIIDKIPPQYSPELAKDGGFIHPFAIEGKIGKVAVKFQIRSFEEKEFLYLSDLLRGIVDDVVKSYKRSSYTFDFKVGDKNIKEFIQKFPFLIETVTEAMTRAGLKPVLKPLRGSTTGASLCALGFPCPNIFTGQHGVHGKLEWICLQDMEKAVETILNICEVWAEKAEAIKSILKK